MNEWEAKYLALSAGIDDPELIENAEKIVNTALSMSLQSPYTLEQCRFAMLNTMNALRNEEEKPLEPPPSYCPISKER